MDHVSYGRLPNTFICSCFHTLGQFCPGERVSSFSCTTEGTHIWSGSALDGQCPSHSPSDVILLSISLISEGATAPCGLFNATVTDLMGGMLSSNISFTASSDLDRTEVVCTEDATQTEVQSYQITIIGKWLTYM